MESVRLVVAETLITPFIAGAPRLRYWSPKAFSKFVLGGSRLTMIVTGGVPVTTGRPSPKSGGKFCSIILSYGTSCGVTP
jgi:hypothetical protein